MTVNATSHVLSTPLATLTSSALSTINTSVGDSWADWDGGDIISNGTTIVADPTEVGEGSYILVSIPSKIDFTG